jgi:excisionase family DNA binding protein
MEAPAESEMTESTGEFVTAQELAAMLRVAKATIYSRVRARQIPHFRVGDRVLFRLSEVLAATRVEATSADCEDSKIVAGRR